MSPQDPPAVVEVVAEVVSEVAPPAALVPSQQALPDVLRQELQGAAQLASDARSARTRQEYAKDLKAFTAWCAEHGVAPCPCPPKLLCAYIAACNSRGLKVSSILRAVSAISQAHVVRKLPSPRYDPEVREVIKGLRRSGNTDVSKKDALLPSVLRKMIKTFPNNLRGKRDRAVLVLGFACGMRRSEVVSLNVEDVAFTREGVVVKLRKSKTDQESKGHEFPVLYGTDPDTCPVRVLKDWVDVREAESGPLFIDVTRGCWPTSRRLSDRAVARLIKRAAKAAGLSEKEIRELGGHSLRAGFLTTAAKLGRSIPAMQKFSRHRRVDVLLGYVRDTEKWADNPSRGVTDADF